MQRRRRHSRRFPSVVIWSAALGVMFIGLSGFDFSELAVGTPEDPPTLEVQREKGVGRTEDGTLIVVEKK